MAARDWTNVTPKGIPEWSLVSLIEASPHDAGTAYAAVDTHKLDDSSLYIFKTHGFRQDVGEDHQRHSGWRLHPRRARRPSAEEPVVRGHRNLDIRLPADDGAHWKSLQLNLPNTPVHDLTVKNDDLVVATHGRSFWILDDLSPLRQANSAIATEDFHLYRPATAIRLHFSDEVDRKRPVGDNPPKGAILDYYLKAKPADKEQITIEILDTQGKLVRRLSNRKERKQEQPPEWPDREKPADLLPADAGINRFAWDFRYDPPAQTPGAFYSGEPPRGPLVIPGTYQVKLTVKGMSQTVSLEVKIDPRIQNSVTSADMQKQIDLALKVQQDVDALHRAVNQIRELRTNLQTLQKWAGEGSSSSEVLSAARALDQKMTPVEESFDTGKDEEFGRQPALSQYAQRTVRQLQRSGAGCRRIADAQQLLVFDELHSRLSTQLSSWQEIVRVEVPALNDLMRKHGVPTLAVGSGQGE